MNSHVEAVLAVKAKPVAKHRYHAMLQFLVQHDFDEAAAAYRVSTSPACWHNLTKAMLVLQQFEQLTHDDFEQLALAAIHDVQETIVQLVCHRSIDDVLKDVS